MIAALRLGCDVVRSLLVEFYPAGLVRSLPDPEGSRSSVRLGHDGSSGFPSPVAALPSERDAGPLPLATDSAALLSVAILPLPMRKGLPDCVAGDECAGSPSPGVSSQSPGGDTVDRVSVGEAGSTGGGQVQDCPPPFIPSADLNG